MEIFFSIGRDAPLLLYNDDWLPRGRQQRERLDCCLLRADAEEMITVGSVAAFFFSPPPRQTVLRIQPTQTPPRLPINPLLDGCRREGRNKPLCNQRPEDYSALLRRIFLLKGFPENKNKGVQIFGNFALRTLKMLKFAPLTGLFKDS